MKVKKEKWIIKTVSLQENGWFTEFTNGQRLTLRKDFDAIPQEGQKVIITKLDGFMVKIELVIKVQEFNLPECMDEVNELFNK